MDHNEPENSGRLRRVVVNGTPYVTWGNLVALALLALSSMTGNLPHTDANASEVHANHSEAIKSAHTRIDQHDVRLATQDGSIAELFRADDRQDRALEATQQRTDEQLKALNGKMDRILEMMIQESRAGR